MYLRRLTEKEVLQDAKDAAQVLLMPYNIIQTTEKWLGRKMTKGEITEIFTKEPKNATK